MDPVSQTQQLLGSQALQHEIAIVGFPRSYHVTQPNISIYSHISFLIYINYQIFFYVEPWLTQGLLSFVASLFGTGASLSPVYTFQQMIPKCDSSLPDSHHLPRTLLYQNVKAGCFISPSHQAEDTWAGRFKAFSEAYSITVHLLQPYISLKTSLKFP